MNRADVAWASFAQRLDEAHAEVLAGIDASVGLEFVPKHYPDAISDALAARLSRDGFFVEWSTDRHPNTNQLRWRMRVKWWRGARCSFWFWHVFPFLLATSPIQFVVIHALLSGE